MTEKTNADPFLGELSARDIQVANRVFLGRGATEAEVARKLKNHQTLAQLRRTYWAAPAFQAMVQEIAPSNCGGKRAVSLKEAETLIHLHVPKTAGSSLSAMLSRDVAREDKLAFSENEKNILLKRPPEQRASLKLIHGHLNHGIDELLSQQCHYLTVLRKPKDRILSLYRYSKRQKTHPLYNMLNTRDMSFGQYLEFCSENPYRVVDTDNGQVRRIASTRAAPGDRHVLPQLFSEALSNIFAPNMTFGLTEHFADFAKRLHAKGIIASSVEKRENVAPSRASISSVLDDLSMRQRDILEEFTLWDQRFYDICEKVYFLTDPAS
ncbi:sulfotransferase family 2 domain-containing protein [Alloyangia pacifica]|uniref:Sulfotransferase family protein n=1 Tax=Alloyangia pacifica TaxID=311180 RepID=A0A1I6UU56_9RHOB|nr:sulfotransferase family 2 domain-containing protein [Alloyangia pacifica]SDI53467.1 Sulfotransferase family protein [Alloyangia pacifica]SFT05022.1 Sulfotransferase family protein [Alloyangia pacifica]